MHNVIRLGVSACLLGQNVRYNGGHKHNPYITQVLGRWLELVPVCPESECGLGIPREPIRLEGEPSAPRLITHTTKRDLTEQLTTWCHQWGRGLRSEKLSGFVLKSGSPSCGLHKLKVFPSAGGEAIDQGVGFFASELVERFPLLPLIEEIGLDDPQQRDHFLQRLQAYPRTVDLLTGCPLRT